MTHCCACSNAPLMFPLERRSVCDGALCVCVCVWRSATWLLASCHFLFVCVCTWRDSEREKATGGKSKTREGKWGNVCEGGGGKKKTGWFIPLEQSSPRQPPSHWQRSGATHRPWTHSLVQRAVDEKHTFFYITGLALWRKKKKFKCSVAAAQQGVWHCCTLKRGNKHTSKQTNKPIRKNCSVYSSSLIFISFWSTLMFYWSLF